MTTFQYHIQAGENGLIVIPTTQIAPGTEVEVLLRTKRTVDPTATMQNGKTAIEDFIDFCTNQPPSDITEEEIEQAKYDYMMEKYG